MTDTDVRSSLNASEASAVLDRLRAGPRPEPKTHTLSPEALAVVARPMAAPISPIVLAGIVRMGEFALIVLLGLVLYGLYLPPIEGLHWRYLVASFVIGQRAFGILARAGFPRSVVEQALEMDPEAAEEAIRRMRQG